VPGSEAPRKYPGFLSSGEGECAMLARIVEVDGSLEVGQCRRELSHPQERVSHGPVRLDVVGWRLATSSHVEELLG
jgi:hypothetical protein